MSDRVDAVEIRARQLPYVTMDCRYPTRRVFAKSAFVVELAVYTDHIMAGAAQQVDEDTADVTAMPCHQNSHIHPMFCKEHCPGRKFPRETAFLERSMRSNNAVAIGLWYHKLFHPVGGRLTSGLYHRFRVLVWFLSEPYCHDKFHFIHLPSCSIRLDGYPGTDAKSGNQGF